MNDLELVATLAEDAPLPSGDDLAVPRARLTTAIAAEIDIIAAAARGRPGSRRHRRLIAAAAVAVAVAASAAVGVAVARPGGSGPVQTAQLTAVQVLDRAASAALRQPAVVPLPSQFLYTKTAEFPSGTAEIWRSIDGAGQFVEQDGKLMRFGGGIPAYYPDMPTRASAMDAFLERTEGREMDDSNPRDLPKFIVGWVLQGYLRPAQQAALYKFYVTLPGLTLVPHVRDVSGRPGVGVSWSVGNFTVMSIFNPQTFAYLGTTSWVGHTEYSGGSWAVLSTAIVDHAGEVP
jgi:hypothetical protein